MSLAETHFPQYPDKQLPQPSGMLFDWHGTLVNTLDAMYHAVDDILPDQLELPVSKLQCEMWATVWHVGDSTTDTIAAKADCGNRTYLPTQGYSNPADSCDYI